MGILESFKSLKQAFGLEQQNREKSVKEQLDELYNNCGSCNACEMSSVRTKVIRGFGNPKGKILFITGKSINKEEQNVLVQALEKEKIFLNKDYYVTNIIKCYSKENSNTLPDVNIVQACAPILKKEIEIIQPFLVVALGLEVAKILAGNKNPIPPTLRGKFVTAKHSSPVFSAGTKIFNTYYPAYVMKHPDVMPLFQEDILKIKTMYEFHKANSSH